ncbi:hypothetical protein ACFQY5_02685 [Paeniroseomonas aquatica]|uniref:Uncharacterized protein n=1 Tax=Paeniroseomonas aquatica TaxID=373043 RepID=A0ABT8A5D2_9PROT|nr:hypothetical protein [Paeniroseomonas aquatica]MDN3564969.1 hypothetical protein [Paeniroseomonas aquatica]
MVQRASEHILVRLRSQAETYEKSEVRLGSIERLVTACDAIESGAAAILLCKIEGSDLGLARTPKINPSNIEKYVRARQKQGSQEWTGPTRVFIASDSELKAYVTAREDERLKPAEISKRPSQRQKDIEDTVSQIQSIEMRQIVRHDLEEGRLTRRRLDILTAGLRTLPGIDVDALLRGTPGGSQNRPAIGGEGVSASLTLSPEEKGILKRLLDRLADTAEMARAGLESDGRRLRLAIAPRTTIIRPDEMSLLRQLAQLEDVNGKA